MLPAPPSPPLVGAVPPPIPPETEIVPPLLT